MTQTAAEQQAALNQDRLEFEKALSAANALEDGVKRGHALKSQMNTLRQDLHAAEVKIAIVETQYQEAQKQSQRVENELNVLKASANSKAKTGS